MIKLCQSFEWCIINGRAGADKYIGSPTSRKGANSVVDYVIVSDSMIPYVCDFQVEMLDQCMSDVHCPILFHLSIPQETSNSRPESNDPEIDHNKECPNRFLTWSREIATVFRGNLNDTRIGIVESTLNSLSNNATQSGVDELCAEMNSIIIESAEESGAYKEIKKGRPRKKQ